MFKPVIKSWKCAAGDTVVFVLKPSIKFKAGKFFFGTVEKRVGNNQALVRGTVVRSDKTFYKKKFLVHTNCLVVTKQALCNTRHGKIAAANTAAREKKVQEWLDQHTDRPQKKRKKAKKKASASVYTFGV